MELKMDSNYYYQIQGQMHISNTKNCYFVVFSNQWLEIQNIEYDHNFWLQKMVKHLEM